MPYDHEGNYLLPNTIAGSGAHCRERFSIPSEPAGSRSTQAVAPVLPSSSHVKKEPESPEKNWWAAANSQLAGAGVIEVDDSPAKRLCRAPLDASASSRFCGDSCDAEELQSIFHNLAKSIDGSSFSVESDDEAMPRADHLAVESRSADDFDKQFNADMEEAIKESMEGASFQSADDLGGQLGVVMEERPKSLRRTPMRATSPTRIP